MLSEKEINDLKEKYKDKNIKFISCEFDNPHDFYEAMKDMEKYADAIAKYKKNSQKKSKPSTGGISIQNMSMTVSFNIDTDNIAQFLKEHGFDGQVTLTISKNISE